MPFADVGDSVIYEECRDDECPDRREGYGHAHCARVERADGSVDTATG
jgi:hypothetical protein